MFQTIYLGTGKTIYIFNLEDGKGKITVNLAGMNAGVYAYTLVVNQNPLAVQKLVVIK